MRRVRRAWAASGERVRAARQGPAWRRRVATAGVAVVAAAGLSACGSSSSAPKAPGIPPGPIKIGALLTLTGPFAAIGLGQQLVDTALVANLNAHGGIAGHPVELVVRNDQGDPATAVAEAEAMVQEHVAAMVYTGTAATDLQSTPVFMKAKIPVVMLAPSDRWDNGKAWPYFFDNYPLNKPTMAYMARFAKRIGITKIGIIDDSSTFASTLEKDFYPAAAAAGLPITKRVSYSPTAVDVTTQVRELEASGANGVALLAEGGLGHVYDAMREVGWTPPIVTTAAAGIVGYSSLGSLAAHAYDNCSVALEPGQQPDPGLAQIMHVVEAKIGVNPFAATSLITNDDFLILKRAIEQTHTLEGTAIAHAIEQFRNVSFTSPNYRYTFTPTHHDGWPNSEIHMCSLAHFGPGDLPIIANP